MRIISGKFRGQKLFSPRSSLIRPTSDRARESIFNLLTHLLEKRELNFSDLFVLDVFAGTGALGFEALSRGAKHVTFMDQSPEAADLIRTHIDRLKVPETTSFLRRDACRPSKPHQPADLVFLDPPYGKNLVPRAMKALEKAGWFNCPCVFVIEVGTKEETPDFPNLTLLDERTYGAAKVLFYSA